MTLGRSSSGAIKIKTDVQGGGLRAVECGCCNPCIGPTSGQNVFQISKQEYDAYLRGGTWSLSSTWSHYEALDDYTSYGNGSASGSATTSGCSGAASVEGTANATYTANGEVYSSFDHGISCGISYSLGRDFENDIYFVKLSGSAHVADSDAESSPCGYPASVTITVDGNNLIAFGTWCPGWAYGDGYTNNSASTLTATYSPNPV
jgi:hypothetical protein